MDRIRSKSSEVPDVLRLWRRRIDYHYSPIVLVPHNEAGLRGTRVQSIGVQGYGSTTTRNPTSLSGRFGLSPPR